jgi:hypothetical protein
MFRLEFPTRLPLRALVGTLRIALREAESSLASDLHDLPRSVRSRLRDQGRSPVVESRLFAALVAGAAGGSPHEAIPVSVLSSLWWTGVETTSGTVAETLRLPLNHLRSLSIGPRLRHDWARELVRSFVPSGQKTLADQAVDLAAVRQRYLTPTCTTRRSAAYARDAIMAVRLLGVSEARSEKWRDFGALFGSLMDLAAACSLVAVDSAPVRAAPVISPLLFAHAVASASAHRRRHLLHLAEEAEHDADARAVLHELVHSRPGALAYHHDLATLHSRARDCLLRLCVPGPCSVRLLSDLDRWRAQAQAQPREVLGLRPHRQDG